MELAWVAHTTFGGGTCVVAPSCEWALASLEVHGSSTLSDLAFG